MTRDQLDGILSMVGRLIELHFAQRDVLANYIGSEKAHQDAIANVDEEYAKFIKLFFDEERPAEDVPVKQTMTFLDELAERIRRV